MSFERDLERLRDEYESVTHDVYPTELRSYVRDSLRGSNETPALLCLLSSRVSDADYEMREVVGVQFIHTGLSITHNVVNDPTSWDDVGVEPVEEDMMLLGANLLVTLSFDLLLPHYEKATRIVNAFGSGRAEAVGVEDFEERLEGESSHYVETYRAAVEIGGSDDPRLLELAENLAVADCLSESRNFDDSELVDDYVSKANAVAEEIDASFSNYIDRIRNETGHVPEHRAGVEVRD